MGNWVPFRGPFLGPFGTKGRMSLRKGASNMGKRRRDMRWTSTDSDARRMYIRGRKKTLKIEGLPLEAALARARITPSAPASRPKPLSSRDDIIAVPPSDIPPKKSRFKKTRWSARPQLSDSAFRSLIPTSPKYKSEKKASTAVPKGLGVPSAKKNTSSKRKVKKGTAALLPGYDGQPRFEGGIRFVQGGLPELGKR